MDTEARAPSSRLRGGRADDRTEVLWRGKIVLGGTAAEVGGKMDDAYLALESDLLVRRRSTPA